MDDVDADLSPGARADGGPFVDIPMHEISYIGK
jgi:hypothetical protein